VAPWEGEGAASAAVPGVVETEWPGVTVERTALEPGPDQTLLLRVQGLCRKFPFAGHFQYDLPR
jgi:hypothetical protein